MRRQAGFTLIELITVVVILGILSVFALPRFAGLEANARAASLQGLGGSVRSGAALVHSVWLARGGGAGVVTIEGQNVTINATSGYPDSSNTGIRLVVSDLTGYNVVNAGGATGTMTFSFPNITTTNCQVNYRVATTANTPPTVNVVTAGGTACN